MADSLLYTAIGLSAYFLAGCLTGLLVGYVTNVSKKLHNPFQVQTMALAIVLGWSSALIELIAWAFLPHE